MNIYTLGTSRRTIEEFIKILRKYDIKTVIDVRRFPTSKFPHFKKEIFQKQLEENKINYVYLGNELGGYRKNGYENYTGTEEFKKGLEKIVELSKKENVVIVCCEKFYWKCHRRFIAEELVKKGEKVVHIIEENKINLIKKPLKGVENEKV